MEHSIDVSGLSAAQRRDLELYMSTFRSPTQSTGHIPSAGPQAGHPNHAPNAHQVHSQQQPITAYRSVQLPTAGSTRPPYQALGDVDMNTRRPSRGLPSNVPAQSQPIGTPSFLSFQNANMRSTVNRQRLDAAAVNLSPQRHRYASHAPTSQTMETRVARHTNRSLRPTVRGAARAPPSLPPLPSHRIDSCYEVDGNGIPVSIKVTVKVYPPPVIDDSSNELLVYRFTKDSFNHCLKRAGLLSEMVFSPDTTISDVIRHVESVMTNGQHQYRFPRRRSNDSILPHESSSMSLLGLVNRGRPRGDGQIRLQAKPSQGLTIRGIAMAPNVFAHPDLCIEDSRLVINLVVNRAPLSGVVDPEDPVSAIRIRCLSGWLYAKFPIDGEVHSEVESENDADEMPLAITAATRASDEYTPALVRPTQPALTPARLAPGLHPVVVAGQPESMPRRSGRSTVAAELPAASRPANSLPAGLWEGTWRPPRSTGLITFDHPLDPAVFEEAIEGVGILPLSLCGTSVKELADKLVEEVRHALAAKDFTRVLSTERELKILTEDGQSTISFGRGVEIEAVHLAFESFTSTRGRWFLPRADDSCSLAISSLTGTISAERRSNLSIFSALTGLLLIYGIAPQPFGAGFLKFLLHDLDIDSLTSDFVAEWYPDLHRTLKAWIDHNPSDDNLDNFQAHFGTYHEAEAAAYTQRDAASHRGIAMEMLYRAVIGPALPSHAELLAFHQGFRLECENGFNLTELCQLVQGGSDALLNHVWTSKIGCFADIAPHLRFPSPSQAVAAELQTALDRQGHELTFEKLLEQFLRGSGVPSQAYFDAAKPHFSGFVNLSTIDNESFRPRLLCWAMTGSPTIDVGASGLTIFLCGEADDDYLPLDSLTQRIMMCEGKICFKTCIKQAKVPVPFLKQLASQEYPTPGPSPLRSFQQAFDHWMLCELLTSIGGHSIL